MRSAWGAIAAGHVNGWLPNGRLARRAAPLSRPAKLTPLSQAGRRRPRLQRSQGRTDRRVHVKQESDGSHTVAPGRQRAPTATKEAHFTGLPGKQRRVRRQASPRARCHPCMRCRSIACTSRKPTRSSCHAHTPNGSAHAHPPTHPQSRLRRSAGRCSPLQTASAPLCRCACPTGSPRTAARSCRGTPPQTALQTQGWESSRRPAPQQAEQGIGAGRRAHQQSRRQW